MNPLLSALVAAGIISQDDADRIARTLDPEAARLFAEQQIQAAFERGLTAQQRRILDELDATNGNPTPASLERLWAQEDELLWASVGNDLISVAIDHAVSVSIGAPNPNTWMLVNEEVVNWVDTRYTSPDPVDFGSIPNLNATSRQQFADAFQAWQLGDRTPGNYAQGLPQLINDLVPIFGADRAEKIATTEVSRVFAQSELFAAQNNEFITHLQWLTAEDELVCPICGPLANTVAEKGGSGFDGVGYPPAHVRCRCSITQLTGPALEALREQGLVSDGPQGAASAAVAPLVPFVAPSGQGIAPVQAVSPSEVQGTIIAKEKQIFKQNYESAFAINDDGAITIDKDGQASSVSFSDAEMASMKGSRLTHNHPGGWQYDASDPRHTGNSFSKEDIMLASQAELAEIRAVTPTYIYTMKRPSLGWDAQWWKDAEPLIDYHNEGVRQTQMELIRKGELTPEQAEANHWHLVWTRINNHVFGLDYTRTEHAYND